MSCCITARRTEDNPVKPVEGRRKTTEGRRGKQMISAAGDEIGGGDLVDSFFFFSSLNFPAVFKLNCGKIYNKLHVFFFMVDTQIYEMVKVIILCVHLLCDSLQL